MQAGTPRMSNGRAELKQMWLDDARRADQAASDAPLTKASSFIAVALLLISSGASATECQSSPGHDGKWWSYRMVDFKRCWYQGSPGRSKNLLQWAKQSSLPPVVTRQHPAQPVPPAAHRECRHKSKAGLDRFDPGADERGADGLGPAFFARAVAIASKADIFEVVDAALDHFRHRDLAGGRRFTVFSEELQTAPDELAGTPGRPA